MPIRKHFRSINFHKRANNDEKCTHSRPKALLGSLVQTMGFGICICKGFFIFFQRDMYSRNFIVEYNIPRVMLKNLEYFVIWLKRKGNIFGKWFRCLPSNCISISCETLFNSKNQFVLSSLKLTFIKNLYKSSNIVISRFVSPVAVVRL